MLIRRFLLICFISATCLAQNARHEISYLEHKNNGKIERVILTSPTIDKLPPRTAVLFTAIMSELHLWPKLLEVFIAHHKPFWRDGFTQEYVASLIPAKHKEGDLTPTQRQMVAYYDMVALVPEKTRTAIRALHRMVLSQAPFLMRIKRHLTWRNAAIAGVLVGLGALSIHHYRRYRARVDAHTRAQEALAKVLQPAWKKSLERAHERDRRRMKRNIIAYQEAIVEPDRPRNQEHALFRSSEDFDTKVRAIMKEIQDQKVTYESAIENVEPPEDWESLSGDDRIFKHPNGLIIKFARYENNFYKNNPTMNLDRATGAFRVNHVAPDVWRARVQGAAGKGDTVSVRYANKKEEKAVRGLPETFRVRAAHARIVPLFGTVTPGMAAKTGDKASPLGDEYYAVIEEPVDIGEKQKFPHEGGKPESYTTEQLHQLVQAGWLGGSSDMHNKNIALKDRDETDWQAKLYDLESLGAHETRAYKKALDGRLPTRREVMTNLYREAMRGHSEEVAGLLGTDEEKEIAEAATDSAWHLQRGIKHYHKRHPDLSRAEAGKKYGRDKGSTQAQIAAVLKHWNHLKPGLEPIPGKGMPRRYAHDDLTKAFGTFSK